MMIRRILIFASFAAIIFAPLLLEPGHADLQLQGYGPRGPNPCSAYTIPGGNLFGASPDPNYNTGWSTTRATATVNNVSSPACATNGTKLIEDTTATNSHYISSSITTSVTAKTYTFTSFAKRNTGTRNVNLQVFDSGFASGASGFFSLTDCSDPGGGGTFGAWTNFASSGYIYSNNWCKVTISWTATVDTAFNILVFITDASNSNSYTGDGTSGISLWGADLR